MDGLICLLTSAYFILLLIVEVVSGTICVDVKVFSPVAIRLNVWNLQ